MYYGDFKIRDDILTAFEIDSFEGIVIHASYDCGDYEGSAYVIFLHEGRFYFAEGSHCSCHGLEDQWAPDVTSVKALLHMIHKGDLRGLSGNTMLATALERLDDLLQEDSSEDEIMCWVRLLL